jgi:XTP/dITP diphosphohydrolase
MDLLIATSNPGKVREYYELLGNLPLQLRGLNDVGLGGMDVEESGATLEANAELKAQAYAQASGLPVLADDTGLFVDALNGAPGVYPARYGGPGLTAQQRREKLLAELDSVPDEQRTARFVCVIAFGLQGSIEMVSGTCGGRIARQDDIGGEGFGYDSIFIPNGYDVPWSRVPLNEKNHISHRGQAVEKIIPILRNWLATS